MPTVVKLGGALLKDRAALKEVADSVAALPGQAVVVHGGGPEITVWQERLGLAVEWREGLRITTAESVQVAAMVLTGWMNKRIVAALLDAGKVALGVSGEDGGLIEAARRDGGKLGEVGEVVAVNQILLRALLATGTLPVVSPICRGPGGIPLNVNADEVAIALATALPASRLLLVSDVPGVLVEGRVVGHLTAADAEGLLRSGGARAGMAVKLRQALAAAGAGVEVRIGDSDVLRDGRAGTRLLPAERLSGSREVLP